MGASSSPRSLGRDSDRLSDPLARLFAQYGVLRRGLRLDDLRLGALGKLLSIEKFFDGSLKFLWTFNLLLLELLGAAVIIHSLLIVAQNILFVSGDQFELSSDEVRIQGLCVPQRHPGAVVRDSVDKADAYLVVISLRVQTVVGHPVAHRVSLVLLRVHPL